MGCGGGVLFYRSDFISIKNVFKKEGVYMPLPNEHIYTINDILALPEGQRAELIDGVIYDMAPPSRIHQRLVLNISRIIADHIDQRRKDCEINISPFGVYPGNDNKNYLEPDIIVVCDKKKLDNTGCHGAPDWIIEVVSPGTRQMDYMRKLFLYHRSGVLLYWIVDPSDNTVTVYDFKADTMERYLFTDSIPVAICEDFAIRVADFK